MPTFLLERTIPPAFDVENPDQVALHSRWATDAYQAAGISWLGGVTTDGGKMYSLIVADSAHAVRSYCQSIGVQPADFAFSEVISTLGPHAAMSRDDVRYRPLKAPKP